MKLITIYVTHSSKNEAEKIVNPLIKSRLIACVNYFPIQSFISLEMKYCKGGGNCFSFEN